MEHQKAPMTETLVLAGRSDVESIAEIESDPDFEGQVGHWPVERHLQEMDDASSRYMVLRGLQGRAIGFVLLQRLGDADRKIHLKRIAVREPGKGIGTRLLIEVLSWVFTQTNTNRVDLDVFEANDRAKRAYEKVGFQVEGLLRDFHLREDGTFSSMWLMSILRRDWIRDWMTKR